MKLIRLSVLLWQAYLHQARVRGGLRAAELRERRRAEQLRETLILDHMYLVDRIARQMLRMFCKHGEHGYATRLELADLVQSGCVGLTEAASRYQAGQGDFARFAYFRIRGAIIDAHKRQAYREELHDSVEGMQECLGFLPARLVTDHNPLPDAIASQREFEARATRAIAELPADERVVLIEALRGSRLAETAEARGRSVAWARAKLSAARDKVTAAVQGKAA